MRIYLNNDWTFCETWLDSFREASSANAVKVRIPHTVKETPFNYFDESVYQMVSGYRRELPVDPSMAGKTLILHFEGVAHRAEVFVNGRKVCEHNCGYTAFEADITGYVNLQEKNELTVKCDSRETLNQPPFGFVIDYMTYGGIYRDVWLDVKDPVYIKDVFVSARVELPAEEDRADVTVTGEVTLSKAPEGEYTLRQTISPSANSAFDTSSTKQAITELSLASYTHPCMVHSVVGDVSLWSPEKPCLYDVRTELIAGGEVLDTFIVRTGFRDVDFRTDGFYLNGVKTKIRGLNRHQSYAYVGYAMPDSQQILDAEILKSELGLNAVRTSHYPQSQAFITRCDEIGLLVFTEIPGWQHIGDDAWKEQAVINTADMVTQYRNHPSIILWGVRINESQDDDALYERTNETARTLDPSRPTGGVRCIRKSSLLEDVYTYNDFIHDGTNRGCDRKNDVTSQPDKPYLVTEYCGHMYPTKMYDSELHRTEHMLRHANVLNAINGEDDISGSFGWCMADYNTHRDFGSGDRICYHGVLDMFRNPKPAAAVYEAFRSDAPVLAVSSQMDIGEHPTGNIGEVWAITNAEKLRMFRNGKFIREYTAEDSKYKNIPHGPVLIDDFVGDAIAEQEEFGKKQADLVKDLLNYCAMYGFNALTPAIKAKAAMLMTIYGMKYSDANALYSKYIGNWGDSNAEYRFEAVNDNKVVKTVVKSPVERIRVQAEADHTDLIEGKTYDAALVRISIRDQNGNVLPFYQGSLIAETEGPAELIGPSMVPVMGGRGGTYIRTTGEAGDVVLKLSNDQLGSTVLKFIVIKES